MVAAQHQTKSAYTSASLDTAGGFHHTGRGAGGQAVASNICTFRGRFLQETLEQTETSGKTESELKDFSKPHFSFLPRYVDTIFYRKHIWRCISIKQYSK